MSTKHYLVCDDLIDTSGASPTCTTGFYSYEYQPQEFDLSELDYLYSSQLFAAGFGIVLAFLITSYFVMGIVGLFQFNSKGD